MLLLPGISVVRLSGGGGGAMLGSCMLLVCTLETVYDKGNYLLRREHHCSLYPHYIAYRCHNGLINSFLLPCTILFWFPVSDYQCNQQYSFFFARTHSGDFALARNNDNILKNDLCHSNGGSYFRNVTSDLYNDCVHNALNTLPRLKRPKIWITRGLHAYLEKNAGMMYPVLCERKYTGTRHFHSKIYLMCSVCGY